MEKYYVLRVAGFADAAEIAKHRGLMFQDMGLVNQDDASKLSNASEPWFVDLFHQGLYKGWVVEFNNQIVAGGGLHLSEIGPLPGFLRIGNAAHIANVYTAPKHRKRGIARYLLKEMLGWCRESGIDQITLTASNEARALYTSLGFRPQIDGMLLTLEHR